MTLSDRGAAALDSGLRSDVLYLNDGIRQEDLRLAIRSKATMVLTVQTRDEMAPQRSLATEQPIPLSLIAKSDKGLSDAEEGFCSL